MNGRTPNSAALPAYDRARRLVAIASGLFLIFLLAGNGMAAEYPSHDITISFDLENHLMQGVSDIRLPPGLGAAISLGDLSTFAIQKNGSPVDPGTSTGITVEPAATAQDIRITYKKVLLPEAGSQTDMVSPAGISLTGMWHPLLDGPAIFRLSAAIPGRFQAIAAAAEIIEKNTASGKTVTFLFPHPLPALAFVAGPYQVQKTAFGAGKELYTYVLTEHQGTTAACRGEKILSYLRRYEELLGPYPFRHLAVAENLLPAGHSSPTFIVLGQDQEKLPRMEEVLLRRGLLQNWLDEAVARKDSAGSWRQGLIAYLADHEEAAGRGEDVVFRKNLLLDYLSFIPADSDKTPPDANEAAAPEAAPAEMPQVLQRSRAAMFFHMLKNRLGNEVFSLGLKKFFTHKEMGAAGWDDLLTAMNEASGQDLSLYFDQWLKKTAVPDLGIGKLKLEEKEGMSILSLHLTQNQEEAFELQVPLEITTPSGTITRTVETRDKETAVEIALDDSPSLLAIDPGYTILRELAPDEIPPSWARFANDANKLAVLPPESARATYEPMVELLNSLNCPTIAEDAATDAELADKSILFLGTATPIARSLFADPGHAAQGVTIDVRENPLGPGHVAVLVTAANAGELRLAVPEMTAHEKFTSLHFINGQAATKFRAESEAGQLYTLDTPPQGMVIADTLDFTEIIDMLADKQVVYVGETHNRNEDHVLQLRVIKALHAKDPNLAIGMEMFNRPSQQALDEYRDGVIDEREFLRKSHYFEKWKFDYRFYRDILSFARKHRLPVVALNLEKDIVSKVFKDGGTTALAEDEKDMIPTDRDLSLPGYRQRISQAFSMHGAHGGGQQGDLNSFLQAQALWDETMAESVADFLAENPKKRLVVVAGMGHTDKTNAIPPRVARRLPEVKQAVVLNSQPGAVFEEVADFVLFSPPAPLEPPPMIGVMLEDTENGLLVTGLAEQGKAQEAGIRKDDIILGIDNEPVQKMEDLKIIMFFKNKGDSLQVSIKRKGFWSDTVMTLPITL